MDSVLEVIGVLMGLGVTGLILVFPIIAWVRAGRAKRMGKQNEVAWQKLTQRVHTLETESSQFIKRSNERTESLEKEIRELRAALAAGERPSPAVPTSPEPPKPTGKPVGAEFPPGEPRPSATVAPATPPLTAPLATPQPVPATARPPRPGVTGPPYLSTPPTPSAAPPLTPPQFGALETPKPLPKLTAKRVLNIEEVLGTNWFSKLGVIGLVIGMSLLMARELSDMGPAGKVMALFTVGAAMLGAGVFFERRERWRLLARAGIGGGWALLYWTTYATNHVQAMQVLKSEPTDFVCLTLVGAAMVAHTLRYDSRVVTGLAFLLAFATINLSRAGPTSLLAGAILAMALVVIVGKRRWFDLEALAIVAIFLNHYYWLRPIIEPMHGHRHHFPEFLPSAALLIFYWAIFRSSYLLRQGVSEAEEKISTVAALLNSFLLLGILKYQSVHPEWAFWCLLALGAIEFTLGQLPITRRRRTAFVILSTIGATLVAAGFPFRYSGMRLAVLWLAEAEALFLAGVFTREILFRWLGIAAELLVAGHIFFIDTRNLGALRDARAADFSDPRRTIVFALAALIIFANAHWVPRRWPDLLHTAFEKRFYRLQSYVAGLLLLAAVWAVCAEPWLAVALAACALVLAVAGARWKIEEFVVLANAFALLAFLRVVFANFAVVEVSYFNLSAVVSITLAAALLYVASRWIGFPAPVRTFRIPEAYTWVATLVVALLAWYQLWPASVALGWALIGLVLFQLGCERRSTSLRLQSYLLFVASFFRVFFVNFNAGQTVGELSPRLYTALPLALLFYFVYGRLDSVAPGLSPARAALKGGTTGSGSAEATDAEPLFRLDRRIRAAGLHCFLGTITVAAAMRFELSADWIAAAWAALLFCFVLIAWRWGRRIFLGQALLLGAAVFFRTMLHNFYQRSYFPPPSFWLGGWATAGSVIALVFFALLVARRMKLPRPEEPSKQGRLRRALAGINRNPAHVFFFVAFVLLTGLLYMELHLRGMATVAWGAEAVAVFLFALAVKERTYRWSALLLLLVCIAKIVLVDVWGLKPLQRDLTIILLSAALVAVSILFTRYKEVLRAYL